MRKGEADITVAELRRRAIPYFEMEMPDEKIAKLFKRSVTTIRRWRGHPDVRQALRERTEDALAASQLNQIALIEQAFATVFDLMSHSGDDKVRLEAAKTVLDRFGHPAATKTEQHNTGEATGPRVQVVLTQQQALAVARGDSDEHR